MITVHTVVTCTQTMIHQIEANQQPNMMDEFWRSYMILISAEIKVKLISNNWIDNCWWINRRTMEIISRIHSWQAVLSVSQCCAGGWRADRRTLEPVTDWYWCQEQLVNLHNKDYQDWSHWMDIPGVVGVAHCILVSCDITVLGNRFKLCNSAVTIFLRPRTV
jgi:hypothetical protein